MYKTKPYAHQLKALELSQDAPYFALTMEQGTGKSKVIIDTCAHLYGTGKINCCVVIAPNGVHRNWVVNEIPTHMPDYIELNQAIWVASPKKREQELLEGLFKVDGKLKVLVMNIEALATERGRGYLERILRSMQVLLVIDESSRIKTPTAVRTKALLKLGKLASYRRICTGTPVTQSPFDIFSQYSFLDKDILQTESYYVFKATYAEMLSADNGLMRHITQRTGGKFTPQVVATDKNGRPQYKNLDRLARLVQPCTFRVLKKDCLDLPDKVYQRRYFDITSEQRRVYNDVKENLRIELADDNVMTMSKLTAVLRLQQITSGIIPTFEGDTDFFENPMDNPRTEAFLESIDEVDGKIIVWCRFIREIRGLSAVISEKWGTDSVVTYFGETSQDNRVAAVKRFQEDPSCRFFIGQPHTAGIGLTLTAATTVVYYSNDFSLETRLQSEDRAHRIGQKSNVTYIDLEATDTVDRRIVTALREKKDVAEAITRDPKEEWLV